MVESGLAGILIKGLVEGVGNMNSREPAVYNKASTDKLIAKLVAERDHQTLSAVLNGAQYLGAAAQRDALIEVVKKLSPSHPILQPSGKTFKDGKSKTNLRLFFEQTFDKELRRVGGIFGIKPESRRLD